MEGFSMKRENDAVEPPKPTFKKVQGLLIFILIWSLLMLGLAKLWDYFELKEYFGL